MLLKRSFKLIVPALLLSLTACQSAPKGSELGARNFKAKTEEIKDEILLDVRTPGEFASGHIKGALNIDWNGDNFEEAVEKLDKNKPVFVYCLSGGRSGMAADVLKNMGFKEVYNLSGGLMKWRAEGLPLTTDNEAPREAGISVNEFHDYLNTDKLVLVDFYAPWCNPCKKMAPYLKEISDNQSDKLSLVKIDADKNTVISKHLNISALPTLLLYKGAKVIWTHTGYISKDELMKKIATFN